MKLFAAQITYTGMPEAQKATYGFQTEALRDAFVDAINALDNQITADVLAPALGAAWRPIPQDLHVPHQLAGLLEGWVAK